MLCMLLWCWGADARWGVVVVLAWPLPGQSTPAAAVLGCQHSRAHSSGLKGASLSGGSCIKQMAHAGCMVHIGTSSSCQRSSCCIWCLHFAAHGSWCSSYTATAAAQHSAHVRLFGLEFYVQDTGQMLQHG